MRHDRRAAIAAHRPAHSEIYGAGEPNGSHFKEMGQERRSGCCPGRGGRMAAEEFHLRQAATPSRTRNSSRMMHVKEWRKQGEKPQYSEATENYNFKKHSLGKNKQIFKYYYLYFRATNFRLISFSIFWSNYIKRLDCIYEKNRRSLSLSWLSKRSPCWNWNGK